MTTATGGVCSAAPGGRSCWQRNAHGVLAYRDAKSPYGVQSMRLRPGADGHAEMTVLGTPQYFNPFLPSELPLRVQLQSSSGQCWESTYSTATKNYPLRFRARSD